MFTDIKIEFFNEFSQHFIHYIYTHTEFRIRLKKKKKRVQYIIMSEMRTSLTNLQR